MAAWVRVDGAWARRGDRIQEDHNTTFGGGGCVPSLDCDDLMNEYVSQNSSNCSLKYVRYL